MSNDRKNSNIADIGYTGWMESQWSKGEEVLDGCRGSDQNLQPM